MTASQEIFGTDKYFSCGKIETLCCKIVDQNFHFKDQKVQKIVQDRNRLSSWKPITLTDIVVSSTKKRERETIQLSFTLLLTVFFRKYFKLSFVILEHTHTHTQYTHSQYLIYCFKVFSFSHTLYLILPSSP